MPEICDTTLMTIDWVLFPSILPPHLRVIWYVFLLKHCFVITCRQKQTAVFFKLLRFKNVEHSYITYTQNELLSMRASVSLKPYILTTSTIVLLIYIVVNGEPTEVAVGNSTKSMSLLLLLTTHPRLLKNNTDLIFPFSVFRCQLTCRLPT